MSFLGLDGFKKFCQLLKGDLDKKTDKENPVITGSLSLGRKSGTTLGSNSTTLGSNCEASGISSHAEGSGTTASAGYDHAEGYYTTASGDGAHSEGKWTSASGQGAHAEGTGLSPTSITSASGSGAHAEGYRTTASGAGAHAEGQHTTASANNAHAEGQSTTASNLASHAEGYETSASGSSGAHSEGNNTTASGNYSHAEGYYTTATGISSHAEGYYTTSLSYQHAAGHHNDTSLATAASSSGTTGTLFVLGNGTSSAKSNAMRVTGTGAVIAKAAYQSTGADYAEWQEWADGNPDNEDRRGYFVVFYGDKIRKATSEDKNIVGVVSANPCIIGNNDDGWRGKFLMDEFGDYIYEEVEVEREEIDPETGETITVKELTTTYKVNPDYDPDMEYVHRKDRPEWDCVGFMGMLVTRSDGTCEVNKRCKPNVDGIATLSDDGNGYLVLSINEENQLAKVLIGVNVRYW